MVSSLPPHTESRLFEPLQVGAVTVQNRIAMAPMTRFRASDEHVPLPIMAEYYGQRASVPGTLLVSEGVFVSPHAGGLANVPGLYTEDQIAAWKTVTDAVHAKGSFLFAQLWSLGRAAVADVAKAEGFEVHGPSNISFEGGASPVHPLTKEEIQKRVGEYAQAAKNAIRAGFDGVEIHGANGYLIDQFLEDAANQRTDEYGGSIANRSRLAIEVATAVVDAIGADRVGIRLSPYNSFQGMKSSDTVAQFSDVINKLSPLKLAFLHVVHPRLDGFPINNDLPAKAGIDFVIDLWDRVLLVAGNYHTDTAVADVAKYANKDLVISVGRPFIANPDLVFRIRQNLPFTPYDRSTFYTPKSTKGYTDYPFSEEFLAQEKANKASI